jgi:hypothetical protein
VACKLYRYFGILLDGYKWPFLLWVGSKNMILKLHGLKLLIKSNLLFIGANTKIV